MKDYFYFYYPEWLVTNWPCCVFVPPAGPEDDDSCKVLVLSYPQYCRYRSMLARLREQPSSLLVDQAVLALGGIAAVGANTRILYCRETFDHPALLHNKSICDQFGESAAAFAKLGRSWVVGFPAVEAVHSHLKLSLTSCFKCTKF